MSDLPKLLTTNELAEMLGLSADTLAQDRYLKQGFPYIKIGQRVRYRLEDVYAYLEANTIRNGS